MLYLHGGSFYFGGTGAALLWNRDGRPAVAVDTDTANQVRRVSGYGWDAACPVPQGNRANSMQVSWTRRHADCAAAALWSINVKDSLIPGAASLLVYKPAALPDTVGATLIKTLTDVVAQNARTSIHDKTTTTTLTFLY